MLLQSEFNRGFAGGCNFGVQHATGEYLLILNNDTIHVKDWIKYLVELMESEKNISSVQPKIKNYYNRDYFDYAGGSGGFMDKYCIPFARGRLFKTIEKDEGQYDDSCQIFWASGTAFLTRKVIFDQIGGFDEILFAHMEEIDFHWKCQLLGYEVWVEPKSIIYHHGALTLPTSSPEKTFLNYRNSLILLLTNYPAVDSFRFLLIRLLIELLSIIKELLSFRWKHAAAILKSWLWIILNTKTLLHRRKKVPKKFTLDIIFKQSIILKYYFMKQKTFSRL